MLRAVLCAALVGCGSTGSPVVQPPPPQPPVVVASRETSERSEQERRDTLIAAHRQLEEEQQTALAATCEQQPPQPRCEPSCYVAEPADPRKGTKLARAEIVHLACRRAETDPVVLSDALGVPKPKAARGRFPKVHKAGSWEADVETQVTTALGPEVVRGDVVRVTGAWKQRTEPVTKEALRCVTVTHYAGSLRRALDACGGRGGVACEASGNVAAHGIDVVHYRLAEAKQLHAAGKDAECQQAALEALAVAHGMPRWRQYVTLNVHQWKASPRYRTRFDGVLDEDTLFTTATALGGEAEALFVQCGGASAKTSAAQEQSFHTCW